MFLILPFLFIFQSLKNASCLGRFFTATDAVCDAGVTLDPKCDREVRVEDDVAMVAGEMAVTGGVGYDNVDGNMRREDGRFSLA